jgi:hypothetical protein
MQKTKGRSPVHIEIAIVDKVAVKQSPKDNHA